MYIISLTCPLLDGLGHPLARLRQPLVNYLRVLRVVAVWLTCLIAYFVVYTMLLVKNGFLLVPAKSRLRGIIVPI